MLKALYEQIRNDAQPQEMILGDKRYTSRKVYPVLEECPGSIEVSTLTGLVDSVLSGMFGGGIDGR